LSTSSRPMAALATSRMREAGRGSREGRSMGADVTGAAAKVRHAFAPF
jgi:hypothetical protein